ncbi:DNA-binding protein [Bacillus sp. FJAT-44742]|uniref:DNA-binding protein n=1 Tax=Bacillus sp. FJAT-44742 TaxID=2014005 RepID=UPI0018E229CB|nr:DNA-binding protein [Bacillus sp. FJAT-44742]
MSLFWLAIGIAAAGYFIGDGLKNFKNPNAKDLIDYLDEDEHELIKENQIHHFVGISKEDVRHLIQEHSDFPHIVINGTTYYPKTKLRNWLLHAGN